MNDYGEMFYGTLPPDTQDFRQVLAGIVRNLRDRAISTGQSIVESGQRARALQQQAFANPERPTQITDPRALQQLTDMIMAGPIGFAPAGITTWHGSPYLFRQFDPTKVGAGEGAQAYGVGAGYTAEARPVAEEYARNISRQKMIEGTAEGSPVQQMVGNMPIQDFYAKLDRQAANLPPKQAEDAYAKLDIVERLGLGTNVPDIREYVKESGYSKAVQNWVEKELIPQYKPAGYLYKGDIPDEILPKFLDWDKPLKDQPEILKSISPQALGLTYTKLPNGNHAFLNAEGKPLGMLQKGGTPETFEKNWMENVTRGTGADFYQQLAQSVPSGGGAAKVTEALNNAGVRGIRYLDQGSRGEGKGTSNFIPFRPEDFKIQEINDIPIEQWYAKGLLDRPLSKVEEAKAAWEANPDNQELYQIYRQLRLGE